MSPPRLWPSDLFLLAFETAVCVVIAATAGEDTVIFLSSVSITKFRPWCDMIRMDGFGVY